MGARPAGSIGRLVSMLHRFSCVYLDRELASYGIGAGQVGILAYLFRNEGVTQDEVACHLKTDKGATAHTIKRLVDEGYIHRQPHPEDGRAYRIVLTEKARDAESAVRAILERWTDILASDLDAREFRVAMDLLERMAANADGHLHDERECP